MIDIFATLLSKDKKKIEDAYSSFLTDVNLALEEKAVMTNQEVFHLLGNLSDFYEAKLESNVELEDYFLETT